MLCNDLIYVFPSVQDKYSECEDNMVELGGQSIESSFKSVVFLQGSHE